MNRLTYYYSFIFYKKIYHPELPKVKENPFNYSKFLMLKFLLKMNR